MKNLFEGRQIHNNSYLPNNLRYDKVSANLVEKTSLKQILDIDTFYGKKGTVNITQVDLEKSISFWDNPYTTRCNYHNTIDKCHHENCEMVRLSFQALKMKTHPSIYWNMSMNDAFINEKIFMTKFLQPTNAPLLDVGCWTHLYRGLIPVDSKNIFGLESYVDAVKVANYRHATENYFMGTMCKMPFEKGAFNTIICYEVVEHIPETQFHQFLKEIKRVASGGILFISTPNGRYWPKFSCCPTHKKEFTLNEINSIVQKHNMKLIWAKGYGELDYHITKKIKRKLFGEMKEKENVCCNSRTILYKIQV